MVNLTPTDIKYLTGAFECAEQPLKVDYKKLAVVLGVASDKVAYNGYRAAMKKIEAAKAASAADGSKNDDTAGGAAAPKTPLNKGQATTNGSNIEDSVAGATDSQSNLKKAKATPKAKATKANKPKSDAIVKAEDSVDDADTPAVEKIAVSVKKNARKATDEDTDGETNQEGTVVKPTPKRARTKKEPQYDADGNLIKPTRKARAPKLYENGNPVTPKRKPAAPKVDENGNPFTPKPRVRKPKDTTATTDGDTIGGTPAPKKANKTQAQQATEKAIEKAAAKAKEAAEKVQEEGPMEKVNGIFEGKTMTPTTDVGNDFTSNADHSFSVVVEKVFANGMNGDVEMEDGGEENAEGAEEEDGAPISPVLSEEIELVQEDYTLTLGEEV